MDLAASTARDFNSTGELEMNQDKINERESAEQDNVKQQEQEPITPRQENEQSKKLINS